MTRRCDKFAGKLIHKISYERTKDQTCAADQLSSGNIRVRSGRLLRAGVVGREYGAGAPKLDHHTQHSHDLMAISARQTG